MGASSSASGGYNVGTSQSSGSSSGSSVTNPAVIQTPQSMYALWLAQMSSAYGDSMFNWAGQNYNDISRLANQGIDQYLSASGAAHQLADQQLNQYQNIYGPENQQLANLASTYSSPSRVGVNMGAAEADASNNAFANWQNTQKQLQGYGVNPSAGEYGELKNATNLAAGASEAGAGNQARTDTQNTGNSLLQASVQQGNTVGAGVNTALNTQYGGLSGAVNTGQSNVNTGVNAYNAANNWYNTAGAANKLPNSGQSGSSVNSSTNSSSSYNIGQNASTSGSSSSGSDGGGAAKGGPIGVPKRQGLMFGGFPVPNGPATINAPKMPGAGLGDGTVAKQMAKSLVPGGNEPTTDDGTPLYGKNYFYGVGYANADDPRKHSYGQWVGPQTPGFHQGGVAADGRDAPNIHAPAAAGLKGGGLPGRSMDPAMDHTMPPGHKGRPMPQHPYHVNGLPDASTGGHVPYELSPSHGHTTDDVVANLNAGEFVIPRRTVHHMGNKFFYDVIAKSDKEMGMHPQPVGAEPLKKGSGADKARSAAESQNFLSGGGV